MITIRFTHLVFFLYSSQLSIFILNLFREEYLKLLFDMFVHIYIPFYYRPILLLSLPLSFSFSSPFLSPSYVRIYLPLFIPHALCLFLSPSPYTLISSLRLFIPLSVCSSFHLSISLFRTISFFVSLGLPIPVFLYSFDLFPFSRFQSLLPSSPQHS